MKNMVTIKELDNYEWLKNSVLYQSFDKTDLTVIDFEVCQLDEPNIDKLIEVASLWDLESLDILFIQRVLKIDNLQKYENMPFRKTLQMLQICRGNTSLLAMFLLCLKDDNFPKIDRKEVFLSNMFSSNVQKKTLPLEYTSKIDVSKGLNKLSLSCKNKSLEKQKNFLDCEIEFLGNVKHSFLTEWKIKGKINCSNILNKMCKVGNEKQEICSSIIYIQIYDKIMNCFYDFETSEIFFSIDSFMPNSNQYNNINIVVKVNIDPCYLSFF